MVATLVYRSRLYCTRVQRSFVHISGNSPHSPHSRGGKEAAPAMLITRRYTTQGHDALESFTFVPRTSRIANPDGSVVFEMKDVLAPEAWSQGAVDILAQKYFRKAGVPT